MKHLTKYWLPILATSLMCSSVLLAKDLDISQQEKDMRIMRGILESSLESAREDFPGRPSIKSTYLAEQGYLFTIRLNGLGSIGIPGVAGWDNGRLELDIPEIIEEAFAAIEYSEVAAPDVVAEVEDVVVPDPFEDRKMSEQQRAYQDKLRALREQQRDLRRQTYDVSRDVRRAEDEKKRADLEKKLAVIKAELSEKKKVYHEMLESYRAQRQSKQIERSDTAVDMILQTVCDYGQTMRHFKKNEKMNILIQGAVTPQGKRASQMYIIDQKDIRGCKDVNKLKKVAIYYTL